MKKTIFFSILAAILCIAAFEPFGIWPFGLIGLIPLFFALEKLSPKKAFIAGWVYGFVFFVGTVYWVVHSMYVYGGVPFAVSVAVMFLLAAYLALFPAFFAFILNSTSYRGIGFALFAGNLWAAFEYLRSELFLGFPWALIGYSQTGFLPLIQMADVAGVFGVSFFVASINALVYIFLFRARSLREIVKYGAIFVLALLLAYGYGVKRINHVRAEAETWDKIKVSAVQGNIEQNLKWEDRYKIKTLDVYSSLSKEAKEQGAELIVWPEAAMPFYLNYDKQLLPLVADVPKSTGAFLLTGAPHYEQIPGSNVYKSLNSAFLFSPDGEIAGRYDKIRLVPFGEYVPLKKILFFVDKMAVGVGDFAPGMGPEPIRFKGQGAGVLICYEVIFPEISRQMVRNGATLLVNITNDGWFGNTSGPYEHFAMSKMRAIENRIYLVRAANTGISALIDPTGKEVGKTRLMERAVLTGEARFKKVTPFYKGGLGGITGNETFFSSIGHIFPFLTIGFSVIMFVLRFRGRRV
ncbi:MAG: apolipoprotein N-acyltransferase [Thermodesulfobacteriota bacterium]